jgi:hypothetical protein
MCFNVEVKHTQMPRITQLTRCDSGMSRTTEMKGGTKQFCSSQAFTKPVLNPLYSELFKLRNLALL